MAKLLAGKTTTFHCIRKDVIPDSGQVIYDGENLGVCPQFTAIDPQLTVRETLWVYGKLKGLTGAVLKRDVDTIIRMTARSVGRYDYLQYVDGFLPFLHENLIR